MQRTLSKSDCYCSYFMRCELKSKTHASGYVVIVNDDMSLIKVYYEVKKI